MTINGSLLGTALLPPAWAAAKYWKTPSGHTATDLSVNNDMSVWGVVTTGGSPSTCTNYVWREGNWITLPTRGQYIDVSTDGNVVVVRAVDLTVDNAGKRSLWRFEWDGTGYRQTGLVEGIKQVTGTLVQRKPWRGSADCKRAVQLYGSTFNVYDWGGDSYNLLVAVNPSDGAAAGASSHTECGLSGDGKVLVAAIQLAASANYAYYVKRWALGDDGTATYMGHAYYAGNPAMSTTDGSSALYGGLVVNFDGSVVLCGVPQAQSLLGRVARFVWDGSKYTIRHDLYPPQGANSTGLGNAVAVTSNGQRCFAGTSRSGKGGVCRFDNLTDASTDTWYWPVQSYGYDGSHAAEAVTVAFGTAIACTPDGKSFIASGADEILPKWA